MGREVVKIGPTRKLEQPERFAEPSCAAVPFRFNTHTLFYSKDAVTLQNELQHHVASRALNQTNARKEFFFPTPEDVRDVLVERVGNILEFSADAEATENRQSLHAWLQAAAVWREST